jgi:hypothetical protein
MKDLHKRIELLANVAIIVVALALCAVLVQRYLLPASPRDEAAVKGVMPGTKLQLPGLDWGQSDRTLLIVLSTTCRFCTESAPFYQRLAQEKAKAGGNIRMVAVLPQGVEAAQKYLGEHGIAVDQVRQAAPGAAYAEATPTLIMVDRTGSVIKTWVGKLPAEKEAEVVGHFLGERAGG